MEKMIGRTFGSLTVIGQSLDQRARRQWLCKCVCGAEVVAFAGNLRRKNRTRVTTQSCTCSIRAILRVKRVTHGLTGSAEYRVWSNMHTRCENPKAKTYAGYGAKGITVDPRWTDFARFLADMGFRPSPKHTIDRKDTNGPYSPENCRWATAIEQANNKSNNTAITFQGRTQNLCQWAREIGIEADTLSARLVAGWSIEKALTTPTRKRGGGKPRKSKSHL